MMMSLFPAGVYICDKGALVDNAPSGFRLVNTPKLNSYRSRLNAEYSVPLHLSFHAVGKLFDLFGFLYDVEGEHIFVGLVDVFFQLGRQLE